MHATTRVALSTLLVAGSVYAFYHTAARRKALAAPRSLVDPQPAKPARPLRRSSTKSKGHGEPATLSEQNQREATADSAWTSFQNRLERTKTSLLSYDWKSLTDVNLSSALPDWSLGLPQWITKLQMELNMEPGSLADEVWTEARDVTINPEVGWDARVRISPDLCLDEILYLGRRKRHIRVALARYLDVPEDEVHEEDVPVIGTTSSGGGLRAMVAGAGYYHALTEAGLFDCTTYTAGVSGSCWLQAVYLSSLGRCSYERVIEHIKSRISVHIAYPPKALELLNSKPTNKYLLRGVVEKLKMGTSNFGLVDLYGLLLGARLLIPSNELMLDDDDLKLSKQRKYVDDGSQPLPIYTTVRHEIPIEDSEEKSPQEVNEERKEKTKKGESWFQWFEMTPYEFYCEDLEAGIPTWALGRRFENGVNTDRVIPEIKLPFLFGVWGSAFCATLSHYYHEIRPFVVSTSLISKLDSMVLQRSSNLSRIHPIDPASLPNPVLGLGSSLPKTCPESLHTAETIQLMDAGMSNNLACYPLMRAGRDVDIVIAFDSSAEIQTANWIGYAEGYAKQRKISGWPVGIGWPPADEPQTQIDAELSDAVDVADTAEATARLHDAQQHDAPPDNDTAVVASAPSTNTGRPTTTLGPCTVWVGSKSAKDTDDEPPPSRAIDNDDWHLLQPDAGIAVIYLPFIAHADVADVDPEVSPYLSTWNFEWTPEQVDATTRLARRNFEDGKEKIRRTVRAVWERKRKRRLEREHEEEERKRSEEERVHEEYRRRHAGDDHFS